MEGRGEEMYNLRSDVQQWLLSKEKRRCTSGCQHNDHR